MGLEKDIERLYRRAMEMDLEKIARTTQAQNAATTPMPPLYDTQEGGTTSPDILFTRRRYYLKEIRLAPLEDFDPLEWTGTTPVSILSKALLPTSDGDVPNTLIQLGGLDGVVYVDPTISRTQYDAYKKKIGRSTKYYQSLEEKWPEVIYLGDTRYVRFEKYQYPDDQ
jgi:hypothetical protein